MNKELELLTAKVNAVNKVNKFANTLYLELVDVFTPLVETKVFTDGITSNTLITTLPQLQNDPDLYVYGSHNFYFLSWTVTTRKDYSYSYKSEVYVGVLRNGVLKEIYPYSGRFDYTVEEIIEKRYAYQLACKTSDDAKKAIPFQFSQSDEMLGYRLGWQDL